MHILVVDDEPQIQRFLKPALKAAGYDVVEAATGGEALKAVATAAPDLVILDLGLPDMDGKDVITSLRGWSEIPILILSARERESEKIAALDLGAGSARVSWPATPRSRRLTLPVEVNR